MMVYVCRHATTILIASLAVTTNPKRRKTMKTDDFVSYDLAQRLKEVEFKEHCKNAYLKIGRKVKLLYWGTAAKLANDMGGEYVSAPTLWQAQKWLREVKGIAINVVAHDGGAYDYDIVFLPDAVDSDYPIDRATFSRTYEEALSEGIASVLQLIKKGE